MIYKLIDYLLTKFKLTDEQSQCIMIMVTNNLTNLGLQQMIDYLEAVKRDKDHV